MKFKFNITILDRSRQPIENAIIKPLETIDTIVRTDSTGAVSISDFEYAKYIITADSYRTDTIFLDERFHDTIYLEKVEE